MGKIKRPSNPRRSTKNSVGIILPDSIPNCEFAENLPNQKGTLVLGLGKFSVSGSSENKRATFDLNPSAVKESFNPVQKDIRECLRQALNSFYTSDKNTYYRNGVQYFLQCSNYKCKFTINAEILALNKTEFTYIYKFDFDFSDEVIHVHFNDNLSNLSSSLNRFRKDLVHRFNEFIKSNSKENNKRTESELDFSSIENIITKCNFAELQKHAPVVSALSGKFNLSQVDARTVKTNTLAARCINVDGGFADPEKPKNVYGRFNEEVFKQYCNGMNDYDIAKDFGVMNLLALSDHMQGRSVLRTWAGCVARDVLCAFAPGVCWANDVKTIVSSSGFAKAPGFVEAVMTTFGNDKKLKYYKFLDKLSSKALAASDFKETVANAKSAVTAFTAGGPLGKLICDIASPTGFGAAAFGVQFSADVVHSFNISKNKVSLPQSVMNVLDECYKRKLFVFQTLNVPSHNQLMDEYENWQTDKGEKINVGVSESEYKMDPKNLFNQRYGVYEEGRPNKKGGK